MAASFPGFRPLSANFTQTPNQFFDHVLGHYPLRVVTVVGILIRSTLGYEDAVTGDRRQEAELALSDFIRPELSEASARQGLKEAIEAGFVVRTAEATARESARYALRWADGGAQREAILRARRAAEDAIEQDPERGLTFRPLNSRGLDSAPPYIKKRCSGKETPLGNGETNPLTVTPPQADTLATANGEERDLYSNLVVEAVREVIALTGDVHSTGRWIQLYEICHREGALSAWSSALVATQQAMVRHRKPDKPGAYFNRVATREMEKRGIHVPNKADAVEQAEVRGLLADLFGTKTSAQEETGQ